MELKDLRFDDIMQRHLDLVLEENETTNITAITDRRKAEVLHIEDSLLGMPELADAPDGRYADIGSGGGFPGIPLAVATRRETTLIESVKRKARILERFRDVLGLSSYVEVYHGRCEEISRERPQSYAVVTARAVGKLPSLMELASPLLIQGGRLVCYKAESPLEELERALRCSGKLGMEVVSVRSSFLSGGCGERTLIAFEKIRDPEIPLPRRNGMAQKRPYA